jgi:hypothetical protein
MKPIDAKQAFRNLIKGKPHTVWASQTIDETKTHQIPDKGNGADRVYRASPDYRLHPKFTLPANAGIFTAGSCFAREIELALLRKGGRVLSWTPETGLKNDVFHRYTTHALISDFRFALDDCYDESNIVPYGKQFTDFTGYGISDTREQALAQRRKVLDVYRRVTQADAVLLTFGLVEAWYDQETGQYLNLPPWGRLDSGRYVLKVTDYIENRRAIEEFVAYLRSKVRPDLKMIFTVSPVPLGHTFDGQDIIVANAYSKATLRAVAQDIASSSPYIDYFPSYEMVTCADHREAWFPDYRHVRPEYVAKIMDTFIGAYMSDTAPVSAGEKIPH